MKKKLAISANLNIYVEDILDLTIEEDKEFYEFLEGKINYIDEYKKELIKHISSQLGLDKEDLIISQLEIETEDVKGE